MTQRRRFAICLIAAFFTMAAPLAATTLDHDKARPNRLVFIEWVLEAASEWIAKIGVEAEPHGDPAPPEDDPADDLVAPTRIGVEAEPHG